MPTHAEKRNLPYTPQQLFDLVADVERYPEFLPWCLACRVTRRKGNVIFADLAIGYRMIREHFGSKVTLKKNKEITVEYLSGPMKYLSNTWKFIEEKDGSCTIDFYVDFEFKNFLLQKLMGLFFNEAVRRMVAAFEARAVQLYGAEASHKGRQS
ncbi:MAG: type II toxin-antitoxin system RatA family toxin [Alphaproteobacteria bacterium]|nr:type II toxin-antitoxin system RatA family toxin [Alphaproteobacteria bacterium]